MSITILDVNSMQVEKIKYLEMVLTKDGNYDINIVIHNGLMKDVYLKLGKVIR